MAQYLYRGFNLNYGDPSALTSSVINGSECHLLRGRVYEPHKTVAKRSALSEAGWVEDPRLEDVAVTGGVSHSLPSTRRFRGSNGLVAVLDNDQCVPQFQRVHYEYDWFDNHPGAICQVLTTADAEIRLDDEGLWGIAVHQPNDKWLIDHWSDDLPAISSNSPFADEAEWMAMAGQVDVSDAIKGVIAVTNEWSLYISQRDSTDTDKATFDYERAAYDKHAHLRSELSYYDGPLYLLVAPDKGNPEPDLYTNEHLKYIYDGSIYRDPEDVPRQFRGWG